MYKNPQLRFFLVLAAFLVVFSFMGLNAWAQAKGTYDGRYFVASKNSIVKSLFGVQHEIANGFTSDLTSGEVWTLERIFKVNVTPVPLYKISATSDAPTAMIVNTALGAGNAPGLERNNTPDNPIGWGLKKIYNDENIKSTSGGRGVNVAILDTGANIKHLDLADQVKDCKDFTRGPFARTACDDKNGHGTHMAGIIAANGGFDGNGLWGVASEANLLVYKVCRNDGTCWADDVAAGVDYAVSNSANIITLGLGGEVDNSILKNSISTAFSKNVLVVAAGGNDGPDKGSINWPAAYANVVSVSAVAQDLSIPDWSSRGVNNGDFIKDTQEIELTAPGVNIQSTWSDGAYRYLSGTALSAAYVAGLAAKFWTGTATSTRVALDHMAIDTATPGDDSATGLGLPVIPRLVLIPVFQNQVK